MDIKCKDLPAYSRKLYILASDTPQSGGKDKEEGNSGGNVVGG
jgi:hypothetical protein